MLSITYVVGSHEFGLRIWLRALVGTQTHTGREDFEGSRAGLPMLSEGLEVEICYFEADNVTLKGDYLWQVVQTVIGGIPTIIEVRFMCLCMSLGRILLKGSLSRNLFNPMWHEVDFRKIRVGIHISNMKNRSQVITQWLSYSEQSYRSFQKFPAAPEHAECKTMCFAGVLMVLSGAHRWLSSSGTEYRNIVKSMKSSSKCDKLRLLRWLDSGAAGITTLISKAIPVHLEPDSPWVILYHVYIKSYNSINLSHSYTPEWGILIWLIYSPVHIEIDMMIHKPYAIDAAHCSILLHPL